jgi:uncharacterized membrane protein
MTDTTRRAGWRRWTGVGAAVAGAFLAGGLAVGVIGIASAQDQPSSGTPDSGTAAPPAQPDQGTRDESKSQRSDEQLLTGTDAEKARAAALAKYPGATIQRVETDSDGVYEAHLITADGTRVTAEMDKNFNITGEEAAGPRK